MYLLNAINKRYLIITTCILILGGVVFFFVLQYILNNQLNEELFLEKIKLEQEFSKSTSSSYMFPFPDFSIEETKSIVLEKISDTMIYNQQEQEYEPHRTLVFTVEKNSRYYKVTISKPLYEKSDLILTITLLLIAIMVLQFFILIIASKYLNHRLFSPFFQTLAVMEKYSPGKTALIELPFTKIKEFAKLNYTFENMHQRLLKEFQELKDFTENASHELQTPLAILQNNIEMMMQNKGLNSGQIFMLDEMSNSVMQLTKMNKQLLILTKIENNQFSEIAIIQFSDLVELKANVMKDFFEHKQLKCIIESTYLLHISMSPVLADVLLNNLYSNAIKYAKSGSDVIIKIHENGFEINNTGQAKSLETEKMFTRFYKSGNGIDSIGLGLAIVKQICDFYHFKIAYTYSNCVHSFFINFYPSSVE